MASSPLRSKTRHHARSVSLPSTSHPLTPEFDEQLSRIRAPDHEATSSSLPSINNRLSGLQDLHDCVGDLLLLPHIEQALAREHNEKFVDEVVDGYLRLLDVCSAAKDVFSQTKQDVQDLLSMLRRKRDANDFHGYLASRKMVKRTIQNSLKDLKSIKNKSTLLPKDKDNETVVIFSMLKEVEAATLAVFESLLSYVGVQSRQSGWSLVSKLIQHKSVSCQDEETNVNEFEKVDGALKAGKFDSIQNQLAKMESSIQDIEDRLECLFRRLIKTRVSLLNILNNH
ncbi:hypothetical protein CsSME_00009059 [Camellia sinensis var. sinensis]